MTYKEAIKHFRSLQKRYTTEHNGQMCEKVALALEAMEKQVPKKVYTTTNRFNVTHYHCPRCECHSELEYENQRYCDDCGQALLWEDTE